MSYRLTKKAESQRNQLEAMRRGKVAARMERPAEERAPELPALRRRIVIEDWDFGHRVHVLELHRTNRIDTYRVTVDGKPWKDHIGWSAILAGLRKSMPRVGAACS